MSETEFENQIDATSEMDDIEQPKHKGRNKVSMEVPENAAPLESDFEPTVEDKELGNRPAHKKKVKDEAAEQRKRDEAEAKKELEKAEKGAQKKRETEEKRADIEREKERKAKEKKHDTEEKHKATERDKMAKKDEEMTKLRSVRKSEEDLIKQIVEGIDKDAYKSLTSGAYDELDANLSLVSSNISKGFICVGKGGLGKTYRVSTYCYEKLGPERVALIDSFTTDAAFYGAVYHAEQKGKEVIILDDVAGLMNSKKILNMLKSATAVSGDNKTRTMSYLTTKPLKDEEGEILPMTFDVHARFIILTNQLDMDNPHVRAVITRINCIHVTVPRKELLNLWDQMIKRPYPVGGKVELTLDERKECLDYAIQHTNEKTKDLNLRTLQRVMDYRAGAKVDGTGEAWKKLSLKLLQQDDRLALVEHLILDDNFESEEERVDKLYELTGDSRATYFRLKAKVMKGLTERGVVPPANKKV